MSFINKILGKIIYAIAKLLYVIMNTLIRLIEALVLFIRSITRGCLALISMGGCLLILLFAGTLGAKIVTDPYTLGIIAFFLLFPPIGTKLASYLKYLKYIITEFLFNLANYLVDGINYQYKPFSEYKVAYKKAEEERKREEQRRYYEQQREWGERFKQQWNQQSYQRGQGSFGHGYVNTTVEFKHKYETSCDALGVSYDVDKNQIKSAYRKKAKEYHPDLSKEPDAIKKFHEINDANEFLNDENIQRYKNLES